MKIPRTIEENIHAAFKECENGHMDGVRDYLFNAISLSNSEKRPQATGSTKNPYRIGQDASLERVGKLVHETLVAGYDDETGKILFQIMHEIHSMIFPFAPRPSYYTNDDSVELPESMPCAGGECNPTCNHCEDNCDKPDQYQLHRDTVVDLCHLEVSISNALDVINHVTYLIGEDPNDAGLYQSLLESATSLLERSNGDITKIRMKHVNAIP